MSNRCRRSVIADHFGETWDVSASRQSGHRCCDVCSDVAPCRPLPSAEKVANAALAAVDNAQRARDAKLTFLKLTNALMGTGEAKFR